LLKTSAALWTKLRPGEVGAAADCIAARLAELEGANIEPNADSNQWPERVERIEWEARNDGNGEEECAKKHRKEREHPSL
jgi:hypothetical protein